jgi:hypothetical protein
MTAPSPFDSSGPPLITLEQLSQDFPVSPVFPFEIAGEMRPVQFRLLSSAEKKRIKRQAEIYVSQDYAELEGYAIEPGEVSNWIGTSGGIEAVIDEWRLRTVVATAVHEFEPGRYAPIFDGRESAREKLSDEMIEVLDAEAKSHEIAHDPDQWSAETFSEIIEDVKKKGSGSSIRYGSVNQDAFITYMVSRLADSVLDRLLRPESDLPKPIEAATLTPSTPPSD